MNHCFFITGTDTDVGKTFVALKLLGLARQRGLSTLGLKPVAAGCETIDGQLMNGDARELLAASSIEPAYDDVNPVALGEAMAPHIAAEREGRQIEAKALAEHCRRMSATADFTLIEGAGGWQVPLNDYESMADMATLINCPVILVVGVRLGCINHSLLTAAAIEQSGLRLAGWVANCVDNSMTVRDQNIAALEERLPAERLGTLPWRPDGPTENHLNLDPLLC